MPQLLASPNMDKEMEQVELKWLGNILISQSSTVQIGKLLYVV